MNVAGYANEIGEAFKSHIPRAAYLGSYVVSSSYCLADSISKGLAVHRVSYLLSISFVPLLCPVALKASTERLHPSLLPTWRPVSLLSLSGTWSLHRASHLLLAAAAPTSFYIANRLVFSSTVVLQIVVGLPLLFLRCSSLCYL